MTRVTAASFLLLFAALSIIARGIQTPALGAAATSIASQTVSPIPTPSSVTAVPSAVPLATKTPDEPPPGTPPPPTPTPLLPEEGGPPGGVIGGHQFVDSNANGVRDSADQPFPDGLIVERLEEDDSTSTIYTALADNSGYWEVRGLPDGRYRVRWSPPIPEDRFSETIPPVQTIPDGTLRTVQAISRIVSISDANRVLDVDFGVPVQFPVAAAKGAGARLPNTGQGGGGLSSAPFMLLAGTLVASLLLASGIAWSRRRAG